VEPNFGIAYFHAGIAYLRKGLIDEAIETFQRSRELVIFAGWAESGLLFCYLRKGDRNRAEQILAEMLEDRKRLPVSPVCVAWALASLGDFDGAFQWLETAILERDSLMVFLHIYTEFLVPALAREPRFTGILDRLGLPH
jgi:tetratricopeptide (TPR) repeat protein